MATLYVNVWEHAGEVALGDTIQNTTVTYTTPAVQSAIIVGSGKKRKRVRLFSDGDCYVKFGEDPTATTTDSIPMGAENPEYFDVESGHKISVIQRT